MRRSKSGASLYRTLLLALRYCLALATTLTVCVCVRVCVRRAFACSRSVGEGVVASAAMEGHELGVVSVDVNKDASRT